MRRSWVVALLLAVSAACNTAKPASVPSTSTVPGASGDPAGTIVGKGGWSRSTSPALVDAAPSARLGAILAPAEGAGWAVVGSSTPVAGGRPRATIWQSADAEAWTSVPLGTEEGTTAYGLTRRGDQTVVVGQQRDGTTRRAAVWRGGGDRFTAVDGGDAFAGAGNVFMALVASAPTGLVAAGRAGTTGAGGDGVALWHSADGARWERLPEAEAVFAGAPGARLFRLAAAPGGLVAIGTVNDGAETDAAAWFSADGRTWEATPAAPDFGGPGSQGLTALVPTDGGLLALGYRNDGRLRVPATWGSVDGRRWEAGGATFEIRPGSVDTYGVGLDAAARSGDGFLATGGGEFVNRMWSSPDGRQWAEVTLPAQATDYREGNLALLAADAGAAVIGSSFDARPFLALRREGSFTEVTGRSPSFPAPRPDLTNPLVAATGQGLVAGGSYLARSTAQAPQQGSARVWASPDGLAWARAAPGPFTDAVLGGLGAGPGNSLVAVGAQPLLKDAASRPQPQFLTWTSADGRQWELGSRLSLPTDSPQARSSRSMGGVASWGDLVIAGGTTHLGDGNDGIVFARRGTGQFTVVPDVPGLAGTGTDQDVTGVCARESGFLVVGGVRTGTEIDAAAWSSPDGATWRRAEGALGGPGQQRIEDCAVAGNGFVAVGTASSATPGEGDDAAVWWSANGLAWQRAEGPDLGGPGEQRLRGVAGEGSELLAVGSDNSGAELAVAMWRSSDSGRTWRRLAVDPDLFSGYRNQQATSVAVHHGRAVVAGMVDGQMAIWSAVLADLD